MSRGVPLMIAGSLVAGLLTALAAAQDSRAGAALYGDQCAAVIPSGTTLPSSALPEDAAGSR
jgi:hypothetical protein